MSSSEHIAVVGKENLVVTQVMPYSPQSLANRGINSGVGECDAPVSYVRFQELDVFAALGEHKIVRCRLVVIEKVLLH